MKIIKVFTCNENFIKITIGMDLGITNCNAKVIIFS